MDPTNSWNVNRLISTLSKETDILFKSLSEVFLFSKFEYSHNTALRKTKLLKTDSE
jgi:hypothetical protein